MEAWRPCFFIQLFNNFVTFFPSNKTPIPTREDFSAFARCLVGSSLRNEVNGGSTAQKTGMLMGGCRIGNPFLDLFKEKLEGHHKFGACSNGNFGLGEVCCSLPKGPGNKKWSPFGTLAAMGLSFLGTFQKWQVSFWFPVNHHKNGVPSKEDRPKRTKKWKQGKRSV